MSILDDYRMFQEQQLAQGINPSVAPRLTQQEQDAIRLAATSSESTTVDSNTGMFVDTAGQPETSTSVTDDTTSYEQRVNNLRNEFKAQYNILEAGGFSYVNPSDLDYIIDEQAKEFAKAGVDSIYDLGKRSVDTTKQNVEVERIADPITGKLKYYYNEPLTTAMGGGKRIEVQPSTVKEVDTGRSLGQGATEKMYIATLPSSMDELFNKKTGETVDVFAGGGTLTGDADEPTTFGNLYTNVEGGAVLNVKFAEDKPIFYPLNQNTSDADRVYPAVVATMLIAGNYPGFAESIGSLIGAKGSIAAKATGNAVIAATGSLALGKDVEDSLLAAIITYGTTYGVDALQSGKFGDYLVDNNILEADTVETLNIPRGAVEDTTVLSGIGEGGAPGDVSLDTAEGLDYSLTEGLDYSLPTDVNLAQQDFTPQTYGESSLGIGAPSNLFDQAGMGGIDSLISGSTGLSDLTGFSDALPNITDAASATTAVDDIIKAAGAGVVTKESVKKVVEEASKFIDLKEVFGDTAGGVLENIIGTGIDYAGLSALQKSLEERGEDIQKEYEDVFTPYTVTTGFGTAEIGTAGATATVGYDYDPIRSAQLTSSLGMFEDLPTTRADATAAQLAATQAITDPQRLREQERLLETLRQKGLLGYGQTMATVGGERRVNPLAESILSAQETARSQEALAAQQFGLTEAQRQANLGSGLLTGAQKIDEAAMAGLSTGRDISATLQQRPELSGLSARSQYDQLVALSEIEKLRGLQSGAKGLFGLPTQQGNVTAKQIQQIIDLGELLKTKTATG